MTVANTCFMINRSMTVANTCFMINRSICEDRMHDPEPSEINVSAFGALFVVFFFCFFLLLFFFVFFFGTMLIDLQIKASKIAKAPL